MTAPDPRMRWWGWGKDGHGGLPASAAELVRGGLGIEKDVSARVELEDVRLPEPRLPDAVRAELVAAVGEGGMREDRLARVAHALGKSYPDLVRVRSGDGSSAPDAVVYPADAGQVAACIAACDEARVAVVPFGGGTSVVGGVEPLAEGFDGAVSIDLARMSTRCEVDERSLTAVLDPGLTGPLAEKLLGERGVTLGHFPQSFEFATIGGFVATRSAGQASTGYGRMDELVLGLRCAAPAGEIASAPMPGSAAPRAAIRELLVGSEGALGVITEATVRVRPRPRARVYEGWAFASFAEGIEAFRAMEQADASPDVARLSDEAETQLFGALAAGDPPQGCAVIAGWEGEPAEVERRRARTRTFLENGGGMPRGEESGAAWDRGRFHGPYLRDDLLDLGAMVETLETAATWTGLMDLYAAVRGALADSLSARGTPPLVLCHVSHLYPSGASLYFTWIARQETGAAIEQWRSAKTAACDAIVGAGGTITHHHAIGTDHLPWLRPELGELGVEALRAVKERLDPRGIMNPGKLPAG